MSHLNSIWQNLNGAILCYIFLDNEITMFLDRTLHHMKTNFKADTLKHSKPNDSKILYITESLNPSIIMKL
jgi:hypothetical protein